MAKKTKKQKGGHLLWAEYRKFLTHIEGLNKMQHAIALMEDLHEREDKKVHDFIDKKGKKITRKNGIIHFYLKDFHDQADYAKLTREADKTRIAIKVMPRSLFVAAVSQFDVFIVGLMKHILDLRPAVISSDKNLAFKDLKEFRNLGEVISHFIEKEIDSTIDSGHESALDWFNNKIGVDIKQYLKDELPVFIEITARRNLFVHADGVANRRYLSICKQGGVKLEPNCKKGSELRVPPKYFRETEDCLYNIAAKLTYLIWEKLYPQQGETANWLFNNEIALKFIKEKRYELAYNLLRFATDHIKDADDELSKILIVNQALAKKLAGDQKTANAILNKKDWSASQDEFKMAVSIIKEEFKEALRLMEKIGKNSEYFRPKNYEYDPVFIPIRQQSDFLKTFKKIFNREYTTQEKRDTKKEKKT